MRNKWSAIKSTRFRRKSLADPKAFATVNAAKLKMTKEWLYGRQQMTVGTARGGVECEAANLANSVRYVNLAW